ncbi:MAG: hypothetical protein LC777_20320, partial [Actinobacteria bacterium]|nr:hypothetical protein [Actinomycetota bacterium]
MRPDAYLIVAAGRRLYAPTLEELAELAACAIDTGDPIRLPRVQERGAGGRCVSAIRAVCA